MESSPRSNPSEEDELSAITSNTKELNGESFDSNHAIQQNLNLLQTNRPVIVNIHTPVLKQDKRKINVNHNLISNSNVNINTSCSDSEHSTDEDEKSNSTSAKSREDFDICPVEKLLEAQHVPTSANQIPEKIADLALHPRIVRQRYYLTKISAIDAENNFNVEYPRNNYEIRFEDLLTADYRSKFIAVIGFPGSGKTILTKKLAKCYKSLSNFVCFQINFSDINYDVDTLTLRELLLDKMYPALSSHDCQQIFEWIVKNDDKCVIILDAYNEAEWKIERIPPAQNYNKSLFISDLIALLFKRHFLPRSTLIMTSRPNSMITLRNKQMIPEIFIYLKDFKLSAAKEICSQLFESDTFQIIDDISSQLLSLCQNPKLLNITSKVVSELREESSELPNITKVFDNLVKTMLPDFVDLHRKISLLSYQRFDGEFNRNDLEKQSLCFIRTQDLIVAKYTKKSIENLNGVKFCFLHKTIQAYFAAFYIYKYMSYPDFKDFVESYLFRPTWIVVRRFLLGLLTNRTLETNCGFIKDIFHPILSPDPIKMKRNYLISQMVERIKIQCEDFENGVLSILDEDMMEVSGEILKKKRDFINLCGDIREYNCAKLSKLVARRLPIRLVLTSVKLSSSDCHSLAYVLREVSHILEVINFTGCELTDHSFSHICSAILQMPGSVDHLKITANYFSREIVQYIIKILPKVKRINMQKCIDTNNREIPNRNLNNEDQRILQDALNKLKREDSSAKTILVDNDQVVILKKHEVFSTNL